MNYLAQPELVVTMLGELNVGVTREVAGDWAVVNGSANLTVFFSEPIVSIELVVGVETALFSPKVAVGAGKGRPNDTKNQKLLRIDAQKNEHKNRLL